MEKRKNPEKGLYQHFKGNLYQVLGIGFDSETMEEVECGDWYNVFQAGI